MQVKLLPVTEQCGSSWDFMPLNGLADVERTGGLGPRRWSIKITKFSAALLKAYRVYVIFIFATSLAPLLCEGALCFKRSLLHSGASGKKLSPGFPGPGCPKGTGCSGEVFAWRRGRGRGSGGAGSFILGQSRAPLLLIWNPGEWKASLEVVRPLVVSSKSKDDGTQGRRRLLQVRKQRVKRCKVQQAEFPPSWCRNDWPRNPLSL